MKVFVLVIVRDSDNSIAIMWEEVCIYIFPERDDSQLLGSKYIKRAHFVHWSTLTILFKHMCQMHI